MEGGMDLSCTSIWGSAAFSHPFGCLEAPLLGHEIDDVGVHDSPHLRTPEMTFRMLSS